MTAVSKNFYIVQLDDNANKYNNTYVVLNHMNVLVEVSMLNCIYLIMQQKLT